MKSKTIILILSLSLIYTWPDPQSTNQPNVNNNMPVNPIPNNPTNYNKDQSINETSNATNNNAVNPLLNQNISAKSAHCILGFCFYILFKKKETVKLMCN